MPNYISDLKVECKYAQIQNSTTDYYLIIRDLWYKDNQKHIEPPDSGHALQQIPLNSQSGEQIIDTFGSSHTKI